MVTDAGVAGEGGERGVGATRSYLGPRREQLFLLPVSMRDWLDDGHLAWLWSTWSASWIPARCIGVRGARRGARRMTRR